MCNCFGPPCSKKQGYRYFNNSVTLTLAIKRLKLARGPMSISRSNAFEMYCVGSQKKLYLSVQCKPVGVPTHAEQCETRLHSKKSSTGTSTELGHRQTRHARLSYKCKKLNSLKHPVMTTVAGSHN